MKQPIQVNQLSFSYNGHNILEDLILHIDKNQFYSVIGPNGTGKSTLLKLITNILTARNNEVFIDEHDVTRTSAKWLAKKIAFVPQNTYIDFDFTVEEVVAMGRTPYLKRFQNESDLDKRFIKEALHLTDTYHLRHKKINAISGGERQRVVIAKAIAQQTEILLLDEPVSHLDIHHQVKILNVIKRLQKEKQMTIIAVLHDLNLAASYSDYMFLLHQGNIYVSGTPDQVITVNHIKEVYDMEVVMMKNPINNKPFIIPHDVD